MGSSPIISSSFHKNNGRPGLWPGLESKSEAVRGSNSVVESQPSKLLVAGSIPVSRSKMHEGTEGPEC